MIEKYDIWKAIRDILYNVSRLETCYYFFNKCITLQNFSHKVRVTPCHETTRMKISLAFNERESRKRENNRRVWFNARHIASCSRERRREQRQKFTKITVHRTPTFTFTVKRSFLTLYDIYNWKNCFKAHYLYHDQLIRVARMRLYTLNVSDAYLFPNNFFK